MTLLALLLAAATPSAAGDEGLAAARRVASLGPRPATSRAEGRAHAYVARSFRRAGLSVAVQRFAVPGRGRSRNVIGVHDTPHSCLRIVMAHTDTTPAGPGANDNASGVGVLVALAGRVVRLGARCDVWLVATGAEERIYTGSRDHLGALALARRARSRRSRLRFALSLDEVGRHGSRGAPFWLRSPTGRARARVEGALLAAGRRAGVPVRWVRDSGSGNSDHREFELLGLPGAKLGSGAAGEPCRHRACDRSVRLRRSSLAQAQRLVERALRAG